MSQQDTFERILASLLRATLDDAHWNEASALIDEACGSKGNMLVFGRGHRRSGVLFVRYCYRGQRDNDREREYYERYYPIDEHLPRLRELPDSRLVHITELYSEQELKTSLTWNEAMAKSHRQNSLKVHLDGPDDSDISLTLADPVDTDGWASGQTDIIKRLLPHVRQFIRVRHALVQAEALGVSLESVLDNDRMGVVQLNRSGRVAAANDFALELLQQGDRLFDEGGALRARAPDEDDRLQVMLGRAIPPYPVQAMSGSLPITRSNNLSPLVLHVQPVEKPGSDFRPLGVAALVLIFDARKRIRISPELVAAALGLTATEGEVATRLAEGRTIREISMATGRSVTTIRWHVRQIFGKLGIGRQLEVARLVLSLDAFRGPCPGRGPSPPVGDTTQTRHWCQ